jgi:hypothetical protein
MICMSFLVTMDRNKSVNKVRIFYKFTIPYQSRKEFYED